MKDAPKVTAKYVGQCPACMKIHQVLLCFFPGIVPPPNLSVACACKIPVTSLVLAYDSLLMTPEITLETRFDEQGHTEAWRNEVARQLNQLLYHTKNYGHRQFEPIAISLARRIMDFEEIRLKL